VNADPVATANAFLEQTIPRAYEMGIRFTDLRSGRAQAGLPFEGNGNHFGTVYAGVIFTLAEVLGGALQLVTFDPTTHYPLVRAMSIDFVAPGRGPLTAVAELDDDTVERVRAEAGTDRKASFDLHATVTGDDGIVVATTVGSYQIRPYGR
jgi:acyl-coenzyme A thioesterase PaaI-like protein